MLNDENRTDGGKAVERFGLRFSTDGISLIQDGSIVASVLRTELLRLSIRHGSHAERPLAQVLFSLFLICLGLLPIVGFVGLVNESLWKTGGMVAFLPFGLWGLWGAIRPGFFILAELRKNDSRKLPIDHRASLDDIRELVLDVECCGYSIEWNGT